MSHVARSKSPVSAIPGFGSGRFVEELDRHQAALFSDCLEDWIGEDNPVRIINAFVDALNLGDLGFSG